MKKKILALILACLMLVTLFASCTKTENGGETDVVWNGAGSVQQNEDEIWGGSWSDGGTLSATGGWETDEDTGLWYDPRENERK